jgi:23S rRNA pseudouridine2604 synthase
VRQSADAIFLAVLLRGERALKLPFEPLIGTLSQPSMSISSTVSKPSAPPPPEPLRLAKHLAQMLPCSRAQAEAYIEGGWVRVNGQVVESPQQRVKASVDLVELDPKASLLPSLPMTVLIHKQAQQVVDADLLALLQPQGRSKSDRTGVRLLQKHLKNQLCASPIEAAATGLMVLTQSPAIHRKLLQNDRLIEHELMVDVRGEVNELALRGLNRPGYVVTISHQNETATGLRFAVKGYQPGQIAALCQRFQLEVLSIKRLRIGRVMLAGLAPGQWRFLGEFERF